MFVQHLEKNDPNFTKHYKSYRNKVKRMIESAQDLYLFNRFQSIGNDPKKLWSEVNTILKKKKGKSQLPSELVIGDDVISDPRSVAGKLNEYFAKKGFILASKLPEPKISLASTLTTPNSEIMSFRDISDDEMYDIIYKHLKPYGAGHDELRSVLIKWAAHIIIPILRTIFSRFVQLGSYPDFFKIAKVTALHKGGSVSDIDQYRPISVLPHLNDKRTNTTTGRGFRLPVGVFGVKKRIQSTRVKG